MEETEFYESKFVTSHSVNEAPSSTESSSCTSSVESGDATRYYDKKSSSDSEESSEKQLLDCVSITVPYKINTSLEYPNRGSLIFIDQEGLARPLYRVPQSFSLNRFIGHRFIGASSAMSSFNIVRSSPTGVILDQLGNNVTTSLSTSSDDNYNFAIDSKLNVSYMVGNNEIYGIRANGVRFVTKRLPPSNKSLVQVVAVGEKESAYTAAKVSNVQDVVIPNVVGVPIATTNIPLEFKGLGVVNDIGYILHMSVNGIINKLLLIKAHKLVFRGMYYFNNRLLVTGSYEGQMLISLVTQASTPTFNKVASHMPAITSFIFSFDGNLALQWFRLITCDEVNYNMIGDITVNKLGQIFTTCRFKGNLALSDYNSTEVDKCVKSDDEAMILIGLQGETSNCRSTPISSWWRVLPVTFPGPQISDYVSLTNNGYDIFMSAYTSNSLSRSYNITDHYFIAAFTPTLADLFYHPIRNSVNRYNSRIIAYANSTLFTGSTTWNNFYVHPFGLISEALAQSGYYLNISLRSPKLIGLVVDRVEDRVNVQFKGYTNVYEDAKVGKDYYVDLPLTTETAAVLTPNMNTLDEVRYYGTAVKNGIILIN